tara:strand:+ start:399 stop:1580 length:1182 start_codon:yes stop_codon:yes gene_type:complete
MSEIRVTNVIGENGNSPVNFTQGINMSGICTAPAFIPSSGQLSHRNLIINGGMTVKQRLDLTMTTTSTYSLDRWRAAVGSSFNWSSATVTQSTTSPDEFGKSLKVDIASTNTPTGSQNGLIQTKIEGQDLQQLAYGTSSAKQCTLSFYVRSNKTGTYCVQVTNPANSKYVLFDYTINSADTWERKSVTFSGNTANTLNNDIDICFEINFHLATGSSDHVSATSTWTTYSGGSFKSTSNQVNLFDDASNAWYLTGCQLEVGSVATPFEHRSFADELNRCLRYCYVAGGAGPATDNYERFGTGWGYDSTRTRIQMFHPVPMRTAPTVSIPTIGNLQVSDSSNGYQCSAYERMGSVNGAMTTGIQFTHSSGVTAYRPMFVEARNTTAARIILSAEL